MPPRTASATIIELDDVRRERRAAEPPLGMRRPPVPVVDVPPRRRGSGALDVAVALLCAVGLLVGVALVAVAALASGLGGL